MIDLLLHDVERSRRVAAWSGSHAEPVDSGPARGHVVMTGPDEIHSTCADTVDVEGMAECPASSDD